MRRADHPAIGLTLDSFHIFSRKTDLKAMGRYDSYRSDYYSNEHYTRYGFDDYK